MFFSRGLYGQVVAARPPSRAPALPRTLSKKKLDSASYLTPLSQKKLDPASCPTPFVGKKV